MSTRRQLLDFAAIVAMVAVVAVAYRPARHAPLMWDDHAFTSPKAKFRDESLTSLWVSGLWPDDVTSDAQPAYYRPLVLSTLRLDAALGDQAADYHVTNVILHLFAAVLLVTAAVRLGASWRAAAIASTLWALAPRLTESVVWVAGRSDVLAGLFGFAALTLVPDVVPVRRRATAFAAGRAAAAAVCLFLALSSKEVALAFAAAIAAGAARSGAWRRRAARIRLAVTLAPPLVAYGVLRLIALAGQSSPAPDIGLGDRTATTLEALFRYASMIVDATRPRTSIGLLGEVSPVHAALGGAVAVLLVVAVVRWRRASAPTFVAATLSLASLGLVVHVVLLATGGSVAADHLLYVPLAGIAMGLAVAVTRAPTVARWPLAVGAIVLGALFVRATRARVAEYTDDLAFWITASEQAHRHDARPRNVLAGLVNRAGDVDLACRLYERSSTLRAPSRGMGLAAHRQTRESLAGCWARSGRYEDAVRLSEELAREYPASGRIQMGLGFARLHVRDFDGSSAALLRAVHLDPRLEPVVGPVLASIPHTRADSEALAASSASPTPADKIAHAIHLADLGRSAEADAAYLDVALDTSLPAPDREHAATILILDGTVASAEKAAASVRPHGDGLLGEALARRLQRRRARLRHLDALRARVEALTM